jgi:hypothetical protein
VRVASCGWGRAERGHGAACSRAGRVERHGRCDLHEDDRVRSTGPVQRGCALASARVAWFGGRLTGDGHRPGKMGGATSVRAKGRERREKKGDRQKELNWYEVDVM